VLTSYAESNPEPLTKSKLGARHTSAVFIYKHLLIVKRSAHRVTCRRFPIFVDTSTFKYI